MKACGNRSCSPAFDGEDASMVGRFQKVAISEAQLHGTWLISKGLLFVWTTAATTLFDVRSALHTGISGASPGKNLSANPTKSDNIAMEFANLERSPVEPALASSYGPRGAGAGFANVGGRGPLMVC